MMKLLKRVSVLFMLAIYLCVPVSPTVQASAPVKLAPPAAPVFSVQESFGGATASGWTLLGSACLTAGAGCSATDPAGSGWLRLTNAANGQAGSAIYNTAFSSSDGSQITFEYASHSGTGADGFTFYLIDGSTATPTTGAMGSGLGYGMSVGNSAPGVTNGYVGIGFDEYGNFETSDAGSCDPSIPCLAPSPGNRQYVAVRGSGSLLSGFTYLGGTTLPGARSVDKVARTSSRKVRITISPGPSPLNITVAMDFGDGFVDVFGPLNLSTAPNQAALPATFKMGFSASTGGANNVHEIRNLTVGGARQATVTLTSNNPLIMSGQVVEFTATVTGSDTIPTGEITFYSGTASQMTFSVDLTGKAKYTTASLGVGTHAMTAVYSGSTKYATATSNIVNLEVSDEADLSELSVAVGPTSNNLIHLYPNELSYNATVATNNSQNPPATVYLKATPKYPGATIKLNGVAQAGALDNKTFSIDSGDNYIDIEVTGLASHSKTYTIHVKGEDQSGSGGCMILLYIAFGGGHFPARAVQQSVPVTFDIQVYYDVRDKILLGTPTGRRYIDLYYANGYDIISALVSDPVLSDEALNLLNAWSPRLATLVNGEGANTVITQQQVDELKTFLAHLSAAGSPALQAALAAELAATPLDQYVGQSLESVRSSAVGYGYYFPLFSQQATMAP